MLAFSYLFALRKVLTGGEYGVYAISSMILAIVLLGVGQILAVVGVILLARHYIEAKQTELAAFVADLVVQPAKGEPSKLSLMIDAAGSVIGSAAARSLVASLNQQSSAVARVANTQSDLLQAQQNPLVALFTGGKRGKGAAVQNLARMLGPMLMGKNGSAPNAPASNSQRGGDD